MARSTYKPVRLGKVGSGTVELAETRLGDLAKAARDAQGRFRSAQVEIRAANIEIGRRAAEYAADELANQVAITGRPQRATHYLINALLTEGIGYKGTIDGFQMGIYAALDKDVRVRGYWRGVEEGSRAHVGRELRGFFINRSGSTFGPSQDRYRQDVRMPQTSKGAVIIIERPIPEYAYLRRGAQQFNQNRDAIVRPAYERALSRFEGILQFAETQGVSTRAARRNQ